MIKLLVALQADDTILLQISEEFAGGANKALAHVKLDRKTALDISEQIKTLAWKIKPENGK